MLINQNAIINLDGVYPEEIQIFITHLEESIANLELLKEYAETKLEAMSLRAEGQIQTALDLEHALDILYVKFPRSIRVW